MKLSVIIVSYKNIPILQDCLDSIKKYNDIGEELEVIVSDNSPDNVLYDAIKAEYDWIKIIKNENKGFGAGNNRGYEISTGEYLLFLNPDTVLIQPIFRFAVDEFENNRDLALFGVQLLTKDLKKDTSFLNIDRYGIMDTLAVKFCRKINRFKDGKMFISGADLFVRRTAFEEAGKFDENIFMYKEEADLIKRIKLHARAKKTAFYKDKQIVHLQGGTQKKNKDQSFEALRRLLETDIYYAKKWNLDARKIFKQKIRYQKFKKFVYVLLCKRARAKHYERRIALFNEFLNKVTQNPSA